MWKTEDYSLYPRTVKVEKTKETDIDYIMVNLYRESMCNYVPLKNKGNKKTYVKIVEFEVEPLPEVLYHFQGRTVEVFETKDLEVVNIHGYVSNLLMHKPTKTTFGQILDGKFKPIEWVYTSEEDVLAYMEKIKPIKPNKHSTYNPKFYEGNIRNWENNMRVILNKGDKE